MQYNGCTWKGGKLRLEKAKEHYLLRLKREWQQDSENASKASDSCNADPSESLGGLDKQKKIPPADKIQLNIFFPKLGKVISLSIHQLFISIPAVSFFTSRNTVCLPNICIMKVLMMCFYPHMMLISAH